MEAELSSTSQSGIELSNFLVKQLGSILANAAQRKFASNRHTEESYVRMTDIKTMEIPNIYFAEWITGVLLGTDEGVIPKNDDSIKILKLRNESYLHLFSIWTRTLKSPKLL